MSNQAKTAAPAAREIVTKGEKGQEKKYLSLSFKSVRNLILMLLAYGQNLQFLLTKGSSELSYLEMLNNAYSKKDNKILFDKSWAEGFSSKIDTGELAFDKATVDSEVKRFVKAKGNASSVLQTGGVTLFLPLDETGENIKIRDFILPLEQLFSGESPSQATISELEELLAPVEGEGEESVDEDILVSPEKTEDVSTEETPAKTEAKTEINIVPEQTATPAPATPAKATKPEYNRTPVAHQEMKTIDSSKIESLIENVRRGAMSANVEFAGVCSELSYLAEDVFAEFLNAKTELSEQEKEAAKIVAKATGKNVEDVLKDMMPSPAQLGEVEVSKDIYYIYNMIRMASNLVLTSYSTTIVEEKTA